MKNPMIFLIAIICLIIILLVFSYTSLIFKLGAPVKDSDEAEKNSNELLDKKQKVLALAAHPDDLEYWVAGTLGMMVKTGSEVIVVIATKNQEQGEIRRTEQENAAKIMGYKKVIFLDLPDRFLADNKEHLKEKLQQVINQEGPDTIFTFDTEKEGLLYHHKDHKTVGEIGLNLAKSNNIKHIYFYHTSAPDTLVDISEIINQKIEALNAHQSQAAWFYRKNFRNWQLKQMLKNYGKIINVEYAEPLRKGFNK